MQQHRSLCAPWGCYWIPILALKHSFPFFPYPPVPCVCGSFPNRSFPSSLLLRQESHGPSCPLAEQQHAGQCGQWERAGGPCCVHCCIEAGGKQPLSPGCPGALQPFLQSVPCMQGAQLGYRTQAAGCWWFQTNKKRTSANVIFAFLKLCKQQNAAQTEKGLLRLWLHVSKCQVSCAGKLWGERMQELWKVPIETPQPDNITMISHGRSNTRGKLEQNREGEL